MAFTGAATIAVVSDTKARITGLSLAGGANGTISLSNGAGAVKLPAACKWHAFKNAQKVIILPVDAIECAVNPLAADVNHVAGGIFQTKAGVADDGSDYLLTLTNSDGVNASPALEIYLTYHM